MMLGFKERIYTRDEVELAPKPTAEVVLREEEEDEDDY